MEKKESMENLVNYLNHKLGRNIKLTNPGLLKSIYSEQFSIENKFIRSHSVEECLWLTAQKYHKSYLDSIKDTRVVSSNRYGLFQMILFLVVSIIIVKTSGTYVALNQYSFISHLIGMGSAWSLIMMFAFFLPAPEQRIQSYKEVILEADDFANSVVGGGSSLFLPTSKWNDSFIIHQLHKKDIKNERLIRSQKSPLNSSLILEIKNMT